MWCIQTRPLMSWSYMCYLVIYNLHLFATGLAMLCRFFSASQTFNLHLCLIMAVAWALLLGEAYACIRARLEGIYLLVDVRFSMCFFLCKYNNMQIYLYTNKLLFIIYTCTCGITSYIHHRAAKSVWPNISRIMCIDPSQVMMELAERLLLGLLLTTNIH